jgi:hypothetical protein
MFPTSSVDVKRFSAPMPALVEETITTRHRGWVKFEGTYWFAKFYDPGTTVVALPGAVVNVVGRVANTLLVVPKDDLAAVEFMSSTEVDRLTQEDPPEAIPAKLHSKTIYVV